MKLINKYRACLKVVKIWEEKNLDLLSNLESQHQNNKKFVDIYHDNSKTQIKQEFLSFDKPSVMQATG